MSERFYAPDLDPAMGEYVLEDHEARHLATVCRAKLGTRAELFDGQGGWATGEVVSIARREVVLRLVASGTSERNDSGLVIACALPKGDRAATLVEKCVELGVAALQPIRTERSVTEPGAGKLDKLRRTVIEACKQSGRNHLMEIRELALWKDIAASSTGNCWLLHLSGELLKEGSPEIAAIGPEGGWTDDEVASARETGWTIVRFPGNILRVETAAIAIASICRWR